MAGKASADTQVRAAEANDEQIEAEEVRGGEREGRGHNECSGGDRQRRRAADESIPASQLHHRPLHSSTHTALTLSIRTCLSVSRIFQLNKLCTRFLQVSGSGE